MTPVLSAYQESTTDISPFLS